MVGLQDGEGAELLPVHAGKILQHYEVLQSPQKPMAATHAEGTQQQESLRQTVKACV